MTGVDVQTLLRLPVRSHGVQLGRPVDLILDRELRRCLGLAIHCGDDSRRFLPLAVADIGDAAIEVASSLLVLDEAELGFYSDRGATFRSIRGATVVRDGHALGSLVDLRVGPDGVIDEVVVSTPVGEQRLAYDDDVRFAPPRATARAAS